MKNGICFLSNGLGYRVLSMTNADGWYAMYATLEGETSKERVLFWALCENEEYGDQLVMGMAIFDGRFVSPCDGDDYEDWFFGYTHRDDEVSKEWLKAGMEEVRLRVSEKITKRRSSNLSQKERSRSSGDGESG